MERRGVRRKRLRVRVHVEPGAVATYTGDVTAGGAFVHSARVHEPGTRVRVVVRLPEGPAEAHDVVRWARRVPTSFLPHVRGGMGIEFTWVSPELQEFLASKAPPSDRRTGAAAP